MKKDAAVLTEGDNVKAELGATEDTNGEKHCTDGGFLIYVILKKLTRGGGEMRKYPLRLAKKPVTVRELIRECVGACLSEFAERGRRSAQPTPFNNGERNFGFTSEEDLVGMREIGKFAFGVHYNEKAPSLREAEDIAVVAFGDGLVRIFIGEDELAELDGELNITEGEVFTFIRLTMLSGIMW